jgi:hypothetical protein
MRQEYEEIKKNRAKREKKVEKTPKTVDIRASAEAILVKVCHDLKLTPPARLNAKATSKSGMGALQAKNTKGYLKVSVRDHDIVIYCPVSFVGVGKPGPVEKKGDMIRDYSQLTVVKKNEAGLEKAFRKALKDHKSWAEWSPTAKVLITTQKRLKKETALIKKVRKAKEQPINVTLNPVTA